MECRLGCGACCIAPSINTAIPGMPHGKPANVRCVNLTDDNLCVLFETPDRPELCAQFEATRENCGNSSAEAIKILTDLEDATR
ncbi:YkgJ family cysteine cluster protein [uncultured Umboniibacter sp.]|uniref:YkgJ family cysteine cluster protein n=1 Tax=uncultured Umboniibacter sp. TaxID=1798917 RepID=UPI00342414E4